MSCQPRRIIGSLITCSKAEKKRPHRKSWELCRRERFRRREHYFFSAAAALALPALSVFSSFTGMPSFALTSFSIRLRI